MEPIETTQQAEPQTGVPRVRMKYGGSRWWRQQASKSDAAPRGGVFHQRQVEKQVVLVRMFQGGYG